MAVKSKILIIGPTGNIGKYIVAASVKAGHPTFALVRESTVTNPDKAKLIDSFKSSGVTFLYGDIDDHASLVKAIKQVDVVIASVGRLLILEQEKIIAAIKEAGNIKRFFPSEFGLDVDRHDAVEPVAEVFVEKARIRRLVEAEGIPYTYLINHAWASYFLKTMTQLGATAPPRDKVYILGDGNVKGAYVTEEDVGTYTIKAVDDPRTLNKALHIRLPANYLTFNEVVSLWEKKIGRTLQKIFVSEEECLEKIKGFSFPYHYQLALYHSMQIKGDAVYEIDPSKDVEAHELYPDVKYTTADEYLNQFV